MAKRNKEPGEKREEASESPGQSEQVDETTPVLWGYSVTKVPGGFAAVRLSTDGQVEFITPTNPNRAWGETRTAAILRMENISRRELVSGRVRK